MDEIPQGQGWKRQRTQAGTQTVSFKRKERSEKKQGKQNLWIPRSMPVAVSRNREESGVPNTSGPK